METTSSKIKLALIIIACLIVLTVVPTGIYCAVKQVNPVEVISVNVGNTSEKIIGKWQSENGATAYEFYESGRFDSYLSVISYSGTYEVKGRVVTLKKIGSAATVSYKASVSNEKLTLTLLDENGEEAEDEEILTFNKVERIDTKTFSELFDIVTEALDSNK